MGFTLFARRGAPFLQDKHGDLVYAREPRQVTRVMSRGPQDERYLLSESAWALVSTPCFSLIHTQSGGYGTYVPDRKRKIILTASQSVAVLRAKRKFDGATESYSHQRVREAHLGAVDGAIARRLDQRQDVVVSRVPDDLLQRSLQPSRSVLVLSFCRSEGQGKGLLCAHLDSLE